MQYLPPRALMRLSIALSALLAVTACVGAPPIVTASSACSSLLPDQWRSPVPGAPFPQGDTVGDWVQFSDAQTGQLDKANDRTISAIGIVERCEARDKAVIGKARKAWWQIW